MSLLVTWFPPPCISCLSLGVYVIMSGILFRGPASNFSPSVLQISYLIIKILIYPPLENWKVTEIFFTRLPRSQGLVWPVRHSDPKDGKQLRWWWEQEPGQLHLVFRGTRSAPCRGSVHPMCISDVAMFMCSYFVLTIQCTAAENFHFMTMVQLFFHLTA